MRSKIIRCIETYEKNGDELIDIYPLHNVRLSFLQDLFLEPRTHLMYEIYKINAEQAQKLEPFVGIKIDTKKYDCFLSCYGKKL